MKRSYELALILICISTLTVAAGRAATFTAGDVVVYRVGDGSSNLVNTGNPVFLDEYTPTGTLVQSIAMPATTSGANRPLIASGTAQTEGMLTLSGNGQYLLLTGYATTTGGTASLKSQSASVVNRVVGRVDFAGNINTTTALGDFADGDTPRSAASTNGTDLWVTGNTGGVRYATIGSTTSTSLAAAVPSGYQVGIAGGQLYATTHTSPNFLVSVGSGLPTTGGQAIASLLPTGNSLTSPDTFFFADLDPATPGLDTVYVADDSNGIMKYCYSASTGAWVYEGNKGSGSNGYRGLTGEVLSNGSVMLFSTRNGGGGAAGGGQLVSIDDASGFDNTTTGSFTLLATASNDTAFRGVALAPVSAVPEPSALLLFRRQRGGCRRRRRLATVAAARAEAAINQGKPPPFRSQSDGSYFGV